MYNLIKFFILYLLYITVILYIILTYLIFFSSTAFQTASPGPATPLEPLTVPPPEGIEKVFSPKLEKIATDISGLNILEVSELSQLLKKRLNLPDQPMMPANFSMAAPTQAQESEEGMTVAKKVKTEFTVSYFKLQYSKHLSVL